ncbi:uncharacterized protein [Halyomorpha halys]|uniref:uncharacterized protein n=1 Tax=Halyomorpha halys TaxID=286706 RepID=UPI0006D50503|nr:thymidylate kinase [Halyomorpha halys]
MNNRGALIVIEGCDCSGKSIQCRNVVESLNNRGIPAEAVRFPDRTTETGHIIDKYLKNSTDLPDQVIHLIFSANRWELRSKMEKLLMNGTTLVVDRYSFSGVAYSSAKKNGMDIEWYKSPERGLLKPDLVLFLKLEPNVIKQRKGFGEERYETLEFQEAVFKSFELLTDDTWKIVDADTSVDKLTENLVSEVVPVVDRVKGLPLSNLWS